MAIALHQNSYANRKKFVRLMPTDLSNSWRNYKSFPKTGLPEVGL